MALESSNQNSPRDVPSDANGYRAARRQLIKSALAAVPAVLTITAAQAQAAASGSGSTMMNVDQLNALGIMQDNGPLGDGGLSPDGGNIPLQDPAAQIDPLLED